MANDTWTIVSALTAILATATLVLLVSTSGNRGTGCRRTNEYFRTREQWSCGCGLPACGLLPVGPWDPTGDSAWAGPNGTMRKYYSNYHFGNGFGWAPKRSACSSCAAPKDRWKQGWLGGAAYGW